MEIDFTVNKTGASDEALKDTFELSDVMIVLVRQNQQGGLDVKSFEPLAVDKHPDTLREIGGHIVDFAQGK